mmetsp:Transcript_27288/g.63859  ORF Transcript_27288/g.63859 Transcript_27288/m.63859 type:complete len:211 (-) Transcript_27288:1062-1694(-)
MCSNFLDSEPVILLTGIPVCLATMAAMASAVTASASILFPTSSPLLASSSFFLSISSSSRSRRGMVICCNSPARLKSPSRRALVSSLLAVSISSCSFLPRSNSSRSACHTSVSSFNLAFNTSTSPFTWARLATDFLSSSSFARALSSICFVSKSLSTFHIISGFDSCSKRRREQASSTRSMLLSGCFRSDRYRSERVAAAMRASSLIRIP